MVLIKTIFIIFSCACAIFGLTVQGQLKVGFYTESCPNAESIIGGFVRDAAQSNPNIAPVLLRLHFHDCFVQVYMFLTTLKLLLIS